MHATSGQRTRFAVGKSGTGGLYSGKGPSLVVVAKPACVCVCGLLLLLSRHCRSNCCFCCPLFSLFANFAKADDVKRWRFPFDVDVGNRAARRANLTQKKRMSDGGRLNAKWKARTTVHDTSATFDRAAHKCLQRLVPSTSRYVVLPEQQNKTKNRESSQQRATERIGT